MAVEECAGGRGVRGNFLCVALSIPMERQEKTTDGVEESALVNLARAGDGDAFAELVRRNQRMVYSVCWRFLGEAQDAADCAQETFLKAYQHLKSFREESSFSTWVHQIAVRLCLNRLASPWHRWRKRMVTPRESDPDSEPVARAADNRGVSPSREFVRQEKARAVREALRSLPEEQRVVVVLRDIEGYRYEEISAMLRIRTGTVKSRLSRARQALAGLLKGVVGDDL